MLPSYVIILLGVTVVSCTVHHHTHPGYHHTYVHHHGHAGSGQSSSGQSDSDVAAPAASTPAGSAPAASAAAASTPAASAPVASAPVASAPVASAPAASEPAYSAPAASAPASSAPASSAPAASAPVASAPAASAPVASAPAASEPASSAPSSSAPSSSAPADSQPAASIQSSSQSPDSNQAHSAPSSSGQEEYAQEDSDVDYLAKNITQGLLHSKVLGESAHFTFHQPHDLFIRVSNRLLARAGFKDNKLAEVAAHAGQAVGTISSKLYFDTIGHEMAKFLDYAGYVSCDNVIPIANWFVKSVELEFCSNGGSDPESVANAVVYGIYDVLDVYGLVDKEKMAELFHVFAETLQERAREQSYEILFDYYGVIKVHST